VNIPVIVQTAHGGIDNVVSAMRRRRDFVVKPVVERLRCRCAALSTSALKGECSASATAAKAG
jgi:DNA-binding NtrC family response regulator